MAPKVPQKRANLANIFAQNDLLMDAEGGKLESGNLRSTLTTSFLLLGRKVSVHPHRQPTPFYSFRRRLRY